MRIFRHIFPVLFLLVLLAACGGDPSGSSIDGSDNTSTIDLPRITYTVADLQTVFQNSFRFGGGQGGPRANAEGTPIAPGEFRQGTPPADFTPNANFPGRGLRQGTPAADFTPPADFTPQAGFQGQRDGARSFVITNGSIQSVLADTGEVQMTIHPAVSTDGGISVTVELNNSPQQATQQQDLIDRMATEYAQAFWTDLQDKGMTGTLVSIEFNDGVMTVVYQN